MPRSTSVPSGPSQRRTLQPAAHAYSSSTSLANPRLAAAADLRASLATDVSAQIALRGMRRLEQRRNMEESQYQIQKARASNLNPPVDLRALEYISKYDENLVCPICRCAFVDPVLLIECDHCFCRECIRQTWSTYSPLGPRGDCPTCRTPAKMGPRSATSKIIVNILDDLVVKCPNHEAGCKSEVKRGEVETHVEVYCGYSKVKCPADDCDLPVRRRESDQGCLHYTVSCLSCRQGMHRADLEAHWTFECADREISCELCKASVLSRHIEQHRRASCAAVAVPCPGAAFGCLNKSKRAQAEVHAKGCALAKLAPVLIAQMQRMDEQEATQKVMSRKLEVLETGFAAMQNILEGAPENLDHDSANETRIPFLPELRRHSALTVGTTLASPSDYDFPQPPSSARLTSASPTSTIRTMHTAVGNTSPPHRAPPEPPGPRPADLPPQMSPDFDLPSPFPPPSANGPYASPLHHLLSMHENLRDEMTRISTTLQELEGRHSMQILNENLRTREEIAYLGGQVAGMSRQVHWLTSSALQRQQGRSGTPSGPSLARDSMSTVTLASDSMASPSTPAPDGVDMPDASAGVHAAMGTAATALRGAARMVNVGSQSGIQRRGTSEEGRTKL